MRSFNMIKKQFLIIFGMIVRNKFSLAAGFFAGLAMIAMVSAPAGATPVTFTASGGNLAASATFDIVGGNLQVTLTNTSLSDVLVPTDVLTALFFDINGVGALTPVSALLGAGSTVFFGPNGGGNVGGEWAYASGLLGAPHGATEGISSSGLNLFGAANFNGGNLQGPASVDGLQYGITSAGDNTSTGNAAVTGNFALIKNSVVFTLSGLPPNFDLSKSNITNVSFQYGTDLKETNLQVPEPGTIMLLGTGLIGIGIYRWRRKKG